MRSRRGGVFVIAHPHHLRHFLQQVLKIKRMLRLAIFRQAAGRVVNRIATDNEELFHPTSIHLRGQLQNAVGARVPRKFPGQHRRAHILERRVDPVDHHLHHDRLLRACHHQTGAWFREQISRALRQPALIKLHRISRRRKRANDCAQPRVLRCRRDLACQRVSEGRNLAGWAAQAMVRHRACDRETILHHVEAVHRILRRSHPPPRRESARGSDIAFPAIEEIAPERKDHIGAIKLRHQTRVITETDLRAETLRLAQERVVLAPAHFRENFFQLTPQTLARGRKRFLHQEGQPGAAIRRGAGAQFA